MSIDLHLHTHHSDGTWSPTALVNHAISISMKHIAITDHDSVEGIKEAEKAANGKLEIIPGIEINTIHINDSGKREDVHVLGYFIDPQNSDLLKVLQRQQDARTQHVYDSINAVAALGIEITADSVQRHAGLGSIGRAHITMAIVEAGGAKDVNEAWEKFMIRTSEHYVPRNSVSPLDAIRAINAAGGIASIAHPGKEAHIDALIMQLREEGGLGAIEAYHRIHSPELVGHFIEFANKHGMLITGGSDCHGPFEDYAPVVGSISVPPEVLQKLRKSHQG
ncbi:MAG: PHP domain-containing protein [Candidatus Melainabacteria bacterium]|nr:PHP domain-containing protein [Candidatus Melainabacteria bacterium]